MLLKYTASIKQLELMCQKLGQKVATKTEPAVSKQQKYKIKGIGFFFFVTPDIGFCNDSQMAIRFHHWKDDFYWMVK